MNAHTSVVAMATAQQAANRPSDDQVIAWLNDRNVAGPFDTDFIEEMRTHIEGADFVARVRDIRKDPEKLTLFLNELAVVGAVDLADAIARLDQPSDDAEEAANLDGLIERFKQASAETKEFEKRFLRPAEKRLEEARAAIPAVYAAYQSKAGPRTWCSTEANDVKQAYDFLGIVEVGSDGARRSVDERRGLRNLDYYAAARRIVADDKLRGRKLRRLTEELDRLRDQRLQLDERAYDICLLVEEYPVSSFEELFRKVEFLSEEREAEDFADAMLRDIIRLKDVPHSTGEAHSSGDEDILTAWKATRAIPLLDRGEDEMGQLEMVMARKVAKTIPGVLAQLWTGVDHMVGQQKSDWLRQALDQDNFGTITLRRAELDFDVRMVVQAIHGLSQMAACQANAGPDRHAWDEALAEYRRLRAISDAMPLDTEGEDDAADAYFKAMDHLILNVRTPDSAAFRVKLELIQKRCADFVGWFDGYEEAINLDVAYLACAASAAVPGTICKAANDHVNTPQLRAWLIERDALMAWMNGKDTPNPGGTEEERDRATWLENAIFGAKATTAEDAYLKLLLASKISADGASLSDEDSAALVAEAERFLPTEAFTAASTPVARMANLIKRIYDLQDEADDIESAGILPSGTMSEPLLRVSIEAGHAICTIPPTSVEDCAQLMDHAVTIAEFVSDNQDERDGLKAPSKAVLSALRGAATRLAPSAALAHA